MRGSPVAAAVVYNGVEWRQICVGYLDLASERGNYGGISRKTEEDNNSYLVRGTTRKGNFVVVRGHVHATMATRGQASGVSAEPIRELGGAGADLAHRRLERNQIHDCS